MPDLTQAATPKRRIRGTLCSSALLGAVLQASPSQAQEIAGAGVYLGYTGAEFMWGVEGYAAPAPFVGPVARFTLRGLSHPSITVAGFGYLPIEEQLCIGIEPGLTLAFPDGIYLDPALSFHSGFFATLSHLHLFAWQEWMLPEFGGGVGVRSTPLPADVWGRAVPGRPQRDADGRRVRTDTHLGNLVEEDLGRQWQDAAQAEYDSVPAFLSLGAELRHAGAPPHLVHAALAAANDELDHTRRCAGLAERITGAVVELSVPEPVHRKPLRGAPALRRLVLESWVDGCLGEGLAAALAANDAANHPLPALRAVQRVIAADEHRHAELAWSVLSWCLATAEPSTRRHITDGLRAMMDQCLSLPETPSASAGVRQHIARRQHERSRQRLQRLLAQAI